MAEDRFQDEEGRRDGRGACRCALARQVEPTRVLSGVRRGVSCSAWARAIRMRSVSKEEGRAADPFASPRPTPTRTSWVRWYLGTGRSEPVAVHACMVAKADIPQVQDTSAGNPQRPALVNGGANPRRNDSFSPFSRIQEHDGNPKGSEWVRTPQEGRGGGTRRWEFLLSWGEVWEGETPWTTSMDQCHRSNNEPVDAERIEGQEGTMQATRGRKSPRVRYLRGRGTRVQRVRTRPGTLVQEIPQRIGQLQPRVFVQGNVLPIEIRTEQT